MTKSVILIDDSNSVNALNAALLEGLNVFEKVEQFPTAKNALQYLKTCKVNELPQFIFLDLNMPDMDGFEFLDEYAQIVTIQSSNFQPNVVILSDHLEYENFEKTKYYKSFGVIDQIRKPLDKEDLIDLIEEHTDYEINS